MQIRVNILDVNIENRGKFKMATVDYKDLDKNQAASRKVSSFGASEKAFLFLASQNPRGNYVVTAEKVGDYWNWTHIEKEADNAGGSTPAAQSAPAGGSSSGSGRVNDDQKQRLIVNQNALGNAIALLNLQGNKKAGVDDVVKIATQLADFVYGEYVPEKLTAAKRSAAPASADALDDDIPF